MKKLLLSLLLLSSFSLFASECNDLQNKVIELQEKLLNIDKNIFVVVAFGYDDGYQDRSARNRLQKQCNGEIIQSQCIVLQKDLIDDLVCAGICQN